MATITTLDPAVRGNGARGRQPYVVQASIDFAAAATAKGSALAAADVIEAINVPANTLVLNAGVEVTTAPSGGTGTVLDLGVTGVDPDVFVDGFAFDSASAGDYAQNAAAFQPLVVGSAADTLDVLVQAATTVSTAGVVRVWAVLVDVDDLGELDANEVSRDVLA